MSMRGYVSIDEAILEESSQSPAAPRSSSTNIRWDHIQNLDEFFMNVYYYHQHGGYRVIFIENVFNILKFVFMVFITVEVTQCVRYEIFFESNPAQDVNSWYDFIRPPGECWSRIHPTIIFIIILCGIFFLIQLVRTVYRLMKFWEIRAFFNNALNIQDYQLADLTWYEVQRRLLEVQTELQICVHKAQLDETDIYNRILRHKNYLIAMVNKSILPVKFRFPIIGEYVYLSDAYLYNLQILLFWGPYAPFQNYWHLRPEYKHMTKRLDLAKEMSNQVVILGLLNLIFSPIILVVQFLTFLYAYAERLKSQPGHFLGRKWTNYGKFYLRHFNELNHEFQARVSLAHGSATQYLNSFVDKLLVVMAKNVAFVAGAICIILFGFTVLREPLMHLPGYLGLFMSCGFIARVCWNLIPDENAVWCPETLLRKTLAHIHYMPDAWLGCAHTSQVRNEFTQLFQYRLVAVLEELLSPILTPLVLIFMVPQHTLEIVDFLRNFTVEVAGVGDLCSFALMDVHKHGHPMWNPDDNQGNMDSSDHVPMENGKTELSLMHFHLTNPHWKPSDNNRAYLESIRKKATQDLSSMAPLFNNPLTDSSHGSMNASIMLPQMYTSFLAAGAAGGNSTLPPLKGNVSRICGPPHMSTPENNYGIVGAMSDSMKASSGYQHPSLIAGGSSSGEFTSSPPGQHTPPVTSFAASGMGSMVNYLPYQSQTEEGSREFVSFNMCASALYMHELHQRRRKIQEMHRSCAPNERNLLEPIEQEPDTDTDPTASPKC